MTLLSPAGLALTMALCCLGHRAAASTLGPEELFARLSPSVWMVNTYDPDGLPLAVGSAVVSAPQVLVTNCHVLSNASSVKVRREQITHVARLEAWDPQRDLCTLRVPELAAPAVAQADITQLKVGQPVFTIGTAGGIELTFSSGSVSGMRRNRAGQLFAIQFSAPISAGSSGGGLFDNQGRLMGLVTLRSADPFSQNLNFALPIHWLNELPSRHARIAAEPTPEVAALTGLPAFANNAGRSIFRHFLGLSHPRAFALSQSGHGYAASGDASTGEKTGASPAKRAMQQCLEARQGQCHLYAVDDEVVYLKPTRP